MEDQENPKGVLQPRSVESSQFGRIKKVFLAYIQNPDVYEKYIPPYSWDQLISDQSLQQRAREESACHEENQKRKKKEHTDLVKEFAEYLRENGVSVAYDGYFELENVECTHQLYEQQIRDSDFVLLVITPSLKFYLQNDPPVEEPMAPLFQSKAMVNLMTVQIPPGTHFVPIFLGRERDTNLVPVNLASASMYTIRKPFDITKGDLYNLYSLFTNQTMAPPEPGPPIVLPQRPRFGAGIVARKSTMSAHDRRLYDSLSQFKSPIAIATLLDISQGLCPQWKPIGEKLGLTLRALAEIEVAAGTENKKEACYQMLCRWREYNQQAATLSRLADTIVQTGYYGLLQHLQQQQR